MKGNQPAVTVLMPVYNAGAHLVEAMESILGQTFHDFEFLIIDDGSTDGGREVIRRYPDPRIRLFENSGNYGLIYTLNRGLALAQGKYIARMDQDDISLPERFRQQVEFMESHPEVGICGTWSKTIGADLPAWETHFPATHEFIRAHMLFNTAITHPSVMMRRELITKHSLEYRSVVPYAEDYDLWVRAAECFRLANLPVVLFHYRFHPHQTCHRFSGEQSRSAQQIRGSMLARMGLTPESDQSELHEALSNWRYGHGLPFARRTAAWLNTIYRANRRSPYLDASALTEVLVRKYLDVVGNRRAAVRTWLPIRPSYSWLIRGLLRTRKSNTGGI